MAKRILYGMMTGGGLTRYCASSLAKCCGRMGEMGLRMCNRWVSREILMSVAVIREADN